MRKIQFNAWDIDRKKMIKNVAVYHDGSIGFTADIAREVYGHDYTKWPSKERVSWVFMAASEVVILQSSEMPDKNGRNMFEADISVCKGIRVGSNEEFILGYFTIAFRNGSFGWIGQDTNKFHPFSEDTLSDCEIIGNTYENQDLIKPIEESE